MRWRQMIVKIRGWIEGKVYICIPAAVYFFCFGATTLSLDEPRDAVEASRINIYLRHVMGRKKKQGHRDLVVWVSQI